MDDIIYIADPKSYELYYINPSLHNKLGNPCEDEWHRKKCYKILQGLDAPCPFCTNHLLNHDTFYSWEHYNPLLDSHFAVQDKLVTFNGVEAKLEFAKDISSRIKLEQDLSRQLEAQRVLNNCISLLHTSEAPEVSINKLLGLVAQYHDAERGYIFMLAERNTKLNNSHEWCADGVEPQIHLLQGVDSSVCDSWFKKFKEDGLFFIDSLHDEVPVDSEEYRILDMQGIQSLTTAPLYNTNGSFMGFIGVDNPKRYIKETTIIRAVSSFVADFIDKSRQMEKLYHVSYFDNLTGMRNRNSYSKMIADFRKNPPSRLGVVYVDINGLKAVNDLYGHQEGDKYIRKLGVFLNDLYNECAFRIGGDEFVMLCPEKEEWCYYDRLGKLRAFIESGEFPLAALGYCWRNHDCNVIEQIEIADHMMYKSKEEQYGKYIDKSELFRHKYLPK
ncbi:GGDEF domain-containing protein [Bengtsoniella intestinalis]|uniref:sensor domain-containing diguanylate cyclase n=1 Tax=Bengtsoniella intestinalis TaxID=3073143 RepID=UPI00391F49E6